MLMQQTFGKKNESVLLNDAEQGGHRTNGLVNVLEWSQTTRVNKC